MRATLTLLVVGAVMLMAAPARPQVVDGLELSFQDGRVTLVASDVPISDILDEWARVGGTRFVDADGLAAADPVTLQLVAVSEGDALRVLLRAAAGYLAAPRPASQLGASRFDRVLIMATSRGASGPRASVAPSLGSPPASPGTGQRTPSFSLLPGDTGGDRQQGDPMFGLSPDPSEQLQQLQELLQQPSFPGGAFGDPEFVPNPGLDTQPAPGLQTQPRPGMIVPQPQTPSGRQRPVQPPAGDPTAPQIVFPPPQQPE